MSTFVPCQQDLRSFASGWRCWASLEYCGELQPVTVQPHRLVTMVRKVRSVPCSVSLQPLSWRRSSLWLLQNRTWGIDDDDVGNVRQRTGAVFWVLKYCSRHVSRLTVHISLWARESTVDIPSTLSSFFVGRSLCKFYKLSGIGRMVLFVCLFVFVSSSWSLGFCKLLNLLLWPVWQG